MTAVVIEFDPSTRARLVEEFRASRGRVGGPFAGVRVLLLTTTDAASGEPTTTPVAYAPDETRRSLVVAAPDAAGEPPSWFADLRADPRAGVENGTFELEVRAEVLEGAERDRVLDRLAGADPELSARRRRHDAGLRVVALHPVAGRPVAGTGWGDDLRLVHDGFRRELALVREEVAGAGPRLAAQLKINCVRLCGGLTHHHTTEDLRMLPAVARRRPDLSDVVTWLQEQHDAMALLLGELTRLLADDDVDPEVLRGEVDRLTVDLEAHLDVEEEHLVPVLNGMVPDP